MIISFTLMTQQEVLLLLFYEHKGEIRSWSLLRLKGLNTVHNLFFKGVFVTEAIRDYITIVKKISGVTLS